MLCGDMTFYKLDWEASSGPTVTVAKLGAFMYRIRSFREPLEKSVREVLVPGIREQFAAGGIPPWQPLAPATQEYKASHGYTTKPLIRTGKLRQEATRIGAWKVTKYEAYHAGLGAVPYGYAHNDGFRNVRTGTFVPAREFLVITSSQQKAIEEKFDNWLGERVRRAL